MSQTLVTYSDVTPDNIRTGDTVTDSQGRTYVAQSDAESDQYGEFNVLSNGKFLSYAPTERVTVTYDESAYADIYA